MLQEEGIMVAFMVKAEFLHKGFFFITFMEKDDI